jgi:peptidoglycan-associated lipoprotein
MKHLLAMILLCGTSLPSCRIWNRQEVMPARDESFSYLGPNQQRVIKDQFPRLYFAEDSAQLSPAEDGKLDEVVEYLQEHPTAKLLIVGYAQDPGTAEYNRVLGEQRAQAVRLALLESGCKEAMLQTLSYGNDAPARSGADARRVELGIVN